MSEEQWAAGVEFVDENERLYFAKAQTGEQVRQFLLSPTGRYLHGRAKEELNVAKEELLKCNPRSRYGRYKIEKFQKKAALGQAFISWCADAIIEGELAAHQLEQYRS